MREAIGATWIFGIVIVFIVLFTGYLAFSINYAKAFSVKDSIIDTLEKYSGPGIRTGSKSEFNTGPVFKEINDKMINVNYNAKGSCKMVAEAYLDTMPANKKYTLYDNVIGVRNEKGKTFHNVLSDDEKNRYHYCIIKQQQNYINEQGLGFSNYFVATFFTVNIDVINVVKINFNFFVSGQTKNIAYPVDWFTGDGD